MLHAMPGPFGERRIVGEIVAAGRRGAAMRLDDQIEGEGLRRLHHAQTAAIERFGHALGSSIFLTVSAMAMAGTAAPFFSAASIARVISAPLRNGRAAS